MTEDERFAERAAWEEEAERRYNLRDDLVSEIAELRARVAELEGMVPRWSDGEELGKLTAEGWRSCQGKIVGNYVLQLMVPPIPLPETKSEPNGQDPNG